MAFYMNDKGQQVIATLPGSPYRLLLSADFKVYGGFLGVLLGGWLADRFHKRDKRSALWVIAFSLTATPLFGLATFLVTNAKLSLILLQFFVISGGLWPGPYAALQQGLAAPRYRATAAAVAIIAAISSASRSARCS